MPRFKTLSKGSLVKIFSQFGFEIVSQKGSHIKLRKILKDGTKQTLTISFHQELDKETLKAIFRQALKYVPEEKLKPLFYGKGF